jgi:hypothetical protein
VNPLRSTRLLWLLSAAAAAPVLAQVEPPPAFTQSISQSLIGNAALSDVRGRAAVNVSAGDANAQSNAAAIAVGLSDASVSAFAGVIQQIDARGSTPPGVASATIGDRVFANAVGMISVNQTSGLGNAQANTVAIGVGFEAEVVAESALATATSGIGAAGRPPGSVRHRGAAIADTAFEGARGLVQVNQSAGSGNSTANNFALRVHMGARP